MTIDPAWISSGSAAALGAACTPQQLTAADGAQLSACAHGGHVLGWTPAGGRPRLWLSPSAGCGPGVAIRGGIPVIFPQFSGRGPLPKHGLARDRAWQVVAAGVEPDGAAGWRAVLRDDEATRAIWPHGFELALHARALGDRLDCTLSVLNTGQTPWSFTAALHGYLTLGDPQALIHGLTDRQGQDNAAAGRPVVLTSPDRPDGTSGTGGTDGGIAATQQRDVAVLAAPGPVRLADPVLGALTLTAEGFGDRVVWNPGPGHGMSDVPDGAEREFVCLEPAVLEPVLLAPGGSWQGRQTLRAEA